MKRLLKELSEIYNPVSAIRGETKGEGFCLSLPQSQRVWKTKGFPQGKARDEAAFNANSQDVLRRILKIPILSLWIWLFAQMFKRYRYPVLYMYHAAEHKTIYLLERNLEPTAENFAHCPKVTLGCSTSHNFLVLWTGILFVLTLSTGMRRDPYPLTYTLAILLVLSTLAYQSLNQQGMARLTRKENPTDLPKELAFALASLPLTLPALLFEAAFALKEPTPEIIEEAMGVAKEIRASEEYRKLQMSRPNKN